MSMSIQVKFTFPGEEFGFTTPSADCKSFAANEIDEVAKSSNVSFGYSGRHDQGSLPTLRDSGPFSDLIGAVLEAKQLCDKELSSRISAASGISSKEDSDAVLLEPVDDESDKKRKKIE